jgi:hypothetical protein
MCKQILVTVCIHDYVKLGVSILLRQITVNRGVGTMINYLHITEQVLISQLWEDHLLPLPLGPEVKSASLLSTPRQETRRFQLHHGPFA